MTDLQDDIVERLLDRTGDQHVPDSLLLEAADLITSLRAQVAAAERKGMLRAVAVLDSEIAMWEKLGLRYAADAEYVRSLVSDILREAEK